MPKTLQKIESPEKVKDPVDDFLRLIKAGIECWRQAGETLCKLVEDDPQVLGKITQRVPWLTHDILAAFQRIGQKQLCPYLLLDGSAASKRLSYLPYEKQVEVYNSKKVQIAYETLDGSYDVRDIDWHFLTRSEAELVFDEQGVRSFDEQVAILKKSKRHRARNYVNTRGRNGDGSEAEEELVEGEAALNEKPVDALKRHLEHSQAALIAARTDLMMIGEPIHKNQETWIEVALKAIGEFRYAVGHKEEE